MGQRETDEETVRDEDLVDVPQMGDRTEPQRVSSRARVGRFLGPVLGVLAYLVIPSGAGGLGSSGRATVAVAVIMAVWWVTEALPIAATALLPIVLFPLTGVLGIEDATAPYANELIFLFMGGFMIALAMQRWGLHRRIALVTVRAVGTHRRWLHAGDRLPQHVGQQHRDDRDDAADRRVGAPARLRPTGEAGRLPR
jgi:solute carrier family 13 (sodium-dependent dicarboxylate transporter), member 2/3/5